jgi:hypothetical protein
VKTSLFAIAAFVGLLLLIGVYLWARRAEKPVENNPGGVSRLHVSGAEIIKA